MIVAGFCYNEKLPIKKRPFHKLHQHARNHPTSSSSSCQACGSVDRSLDHRYWSCSRIRPLIIEAFSVLGRPPDLRAWISGSGLEDDDLAILASTKSIIYRYFVQVGLTGDDPRQGRPKFQRTDENVQKITDLIKENPRTTLLELEQDTGISKTTIGRIVTEDLKLKKTPAKFIPRFLTNEQKLCRLATCEDMMKMTRTETEWKDKIITGDETWVYGYDPETKPQSAEWRDIAPIDFFLFPKLKAVLKGRHFDTRDDIIEKSPLALKSIPKEAYKNCFDNWEKRWRCTRGTGHDNHGGKKLATASTEKIDLKIRKKAKVQVLNPRHIEERKTCSKALYEKNLAGEKWKNVVTLDEAWVYLNDSNQLRAIYYANSQKNTFQNWVKQCKYRGSFDFLTSYERIYVICRLFQESATCGLRSTCSSLDVKLKQQSSFDQVSEFDRGRIVAYRDCVLSFKEIGSRVGRNQTTVMRICDRWMQEGTTDRRVRSHPPQCTTSRADRQILRMAVTDRSVTSRTVAQHIQSVTLHLVSARTIRRRLQQSGLSARRPLLRLPLTQNNRRLRRQWYDERRMSTAESRFCLQHHDDRIRVWRHRGERMLNSCVMHRHTGCRVQRRSAQALFCPDARSLLFWSRGGKKTVESQR
ncbi:hypothetical protein LAZ67_9002722 [Cordylochernes scorpioides]|uniref:Transposase Tc1-like domain-containing protein n=1 Tax=Cordylochernes scorpioides TaxID=51811 RepID=A0ABY6KU20_9ARAC|nr:hypothetical protein LAZ67_9002722 [Cordylochernes scorpioides]